MPAAQFTPPRQWEDWLSWGLGIWLCISPWALHFDLQPTATRTAVITGFVLILVEAVTLSVFRAWEEWLNIAIGIWLIAAPWVIPVGGVAVDRQFRHSRRAGAGAGALRIAAGRGLGRALSYFAYMVDGSQVTRIGKK